MSFYVDIAATEEEEIRNFSIIEHDIFTNSTEDEACSCMSGLSSGIIIYGRQLEGNFSTHSNNSNIAFRLLIH